MGPAEAAAAVLQELKKIKVLGYQTPGLVSKQNFLAMNDGSGILLTTAVFHLYPENKIWEQGVKPDEKMEGTDQSFQAFLEKTQTLIGHN